MNERARVEKLTDAQITAQAARIITIAMGTDKTGRGRGTKTVYRADQDPLAFWLGVESILELVYRTRPIPEGSDD